MRGATEEGPWKNRVRETRERLSLEAGRDITQAEIADKAGICQNTMSAIELGWLSGRKHMDDIARALGSSPLDLFGDYYSLLTYEEAGEYVGVSASLISRRVEDGEITATKIAGIRLVPLAELEGKQLRKRPGVSIRQRIRSRLEAEPNGLATTDLLDGFRPFESETAEHKAKQSIQSILSRSPEFQPDKAQQPPRWYLVA